MQLLLYVLTHFNSGRSRPETGNLSSRKFVTSIGAVNLTIVQDKRSFLRENPESYPRREKSGQTFLSNAGLEGALAGLARVLQRASAIVLKATGRKYSPPSDSIACLSHSLADRHFETMGGSLSVGRAAA